MTFQNIRRGKTQSVVNQHHCHAERLLLSISSALKTQGRDPKQKLFRMTLCNKGAFTLIELLVVVLIIGILVAVALPQYQKAVEKSRATEVMVFLKVMQQAQHVYHWEHGTYANSFKKLDIMPSKSLTVDWYFRMYCDGSICSRVYAHRDGKYGQNVGFVAFLKTNRIFCFERKNTTDGSYCTKIFGAQKDSFYDNWQYYVMP